MTAHVRVARARRAAGHAEPGGRHRPAARRARLRRARDRRRARDEGGQRDRRRRRGARCWRSRPASTRCSIGHDLGEEAVAARAERARRRGRGRRARRGRGSARRPAASRDRGVGRRARARGARSTATRGRTRRARRARRSTATSRSTRPPLVVELRPRANIAAGEAEHSLGAVLAERLPGRRPSCSTSPTPSGARSSMRGARRIVVVVRDAHRHAWMREAGRAARADAIVVEIGLPLWRPARGARLRRHVRRQPRRASRRVAERLLEASEVPA